MEIVSDTATGSAPDWAFGVHNTPLTYTAELRPIRGTGSLTGFLLPTDEIIPNNREFVIGLQALIAEARARGQL